MNLIQHTIAVATSIFLIAILLGLVSMMAIRAQFQLNKSAIILAIPTLGFSVLYLSFYNVLLPLEETLSTWRDLVFNRGAETLLEVKQVFYNAGMKDAAIDLDGRASQTWLSLLWITSQSLLIQFSLVLLVASSLTSFIQNGYTLRPALNVSGTNALLSVCRRLRAHSKTLKARSRWGALRQRAKAVLIFGGSSFIMMTILGGAAMCAHWFFAEQSFRLSPEKLQEISEIPGHAKSSASASIAAGRALFMPPSIVLVLMAPLSSLLLFMPIFAIYWFRDGAAIRAWMSADALLRPTAETALANDHRAPVVVLRTFYDEDAATHADNFVSGAMKPRTRLEEIVAPVLRSIGPVVAIGKPNEPIPRLGADRAYFPDEKWQDGILRWIALSQLIVIFLGRGQGLRWELQEIAKSKSWNKVILVFPATAGSIKRQLLEDLFPVIHGLENKCSVLDFDTITMISLVGRDPLFVSGNGMYVADYESAAVLASEHFLGIRA